MLGPWRVNLKKATEIIDNVENSEFGTVICSFLMVMSQRIVETHPGGWALFHI